MNEALPDLAALLARLIDQTTHHVQEIDVERDYIVPKGGGRAPELLDGLLDPLRMGPRRIRARPTLETAASFLAYLERFAFAMDVKPLIFATPPDSQTRENCVREYGRFLCVFDYHDTASAEVTVEETELDAIGEADAARIDSPPPAAPAPAAIDVCRARWGQHLAELILVPTIEWREWRGSDGKSFEQSGFAEFLEDHLPDIHAGGDDDPRRYPDAATMLEVARNMHATSSVSFTRAEREASGDVVLAFQEETAATSGAPGAAGSFAVPETFAIKLSPFEGGEPYIVEARLRYRIRSGNLSLSYRLVRPDRTERDAFHRIREQIEGGTDIPIVTGSVGAAPESAS